MNSRLFVLFLSLFIAFSPIKGFDLLDRLASSNKFKAISAAALLGVIAYKIKNILAEEDREKQRILELPNQLLTAAKKGDFATINQMIEEGLVDLNYQDEKGNTALIYSIEQILNLLTTLKLQHSIKQQEKIQQYIDSLSDPIMKFLVQRIIKSEKFNNVIKKSIIQYLNVMELLLENDASIDIKNLQKDTAFMLFTVMLAELKEYILNQDYVIEQEGGIFGGLTLTEEDKEILNKLKTLKPYFASPVKQLFKFLFQ